MMDETVKEIIEISKDSKYIIIAPNWFSAADGQVLRKALDDFMTDPNKVFLVLTEGFELRKVE